MISKKPFRYYLATVLPLVPATIYVALAYYMPLQYQFVVEDAIARTWPAIYATAISIFYAASTFLLFKRHGILTPVAALLASTPAIASMISWWIASGLSPALVLMTLAMGVALIGLYRFTPQRIETARAPLAGAVSLFLLFTLADAVSPVEMPRTVGALAILALFAGMIGILLSAAWLHPRMGIVSVVYCGIAILFFSSNDHVVPNSPSTFQSTAVYDALQKWLPERADREAYQKAGLPYPVVFVSSEGGGIYAAAHAYKVLSILDRHCPTFRQHVLMTVGVSGGAIGNALFAASVDPTQKDHAPCTAGEVTIDDTAFSKDHLSPVLARLLLLETVDRLLPGPWLGKDRAFILTQSFRSASPQKEVLDKLAGEGFDPKSGRPTVVSVATNVANGRRFVMSPISAEGTAEWWPGGQIASQRDTSIIEAAGIAARFPWLTPTARLPTTKDTYRLLADGGYFENSGADTVFDIIAALRHVESWQTNDAASGNTEASNCRLYVARNFRNKVKWSGCDLHIFPIHLAITSTDINPAEESVSDEKPPANPAQSFAFDPISALLSTRNSRGALALARSRDEQCGTDNGECVSHTDASLGFFRSTISADELKLPLGWFMSRNALKNLSDAAIPVEAFNYKAGPENNENDIAPLIHHFDLSLFAKGAKPSVEELLGSP
jgi:hypothetical protein